MKGTFKAALVAAVVSAFVAAGAAVATTQAFTLGATNRVNAPSSVTNLQSNGTTVNPVDAPLLTLDNRSTTANATPLSLIASPNHAPLKVNTGVKVTNLNADRLDGIDSSRFLLATGKAADADKLDGLSSESFTQGGGRFYTTHRDGVALGAQGTLLDIPGVTTLTYTCGDPTYGNVALISVSSLTNLSLGGEVATSRVPPYDLWVGRLTAGGGFYGEDMLWHLMGSRPFNRVTFEPSVLVDARIAGRWIQPTNQCSFEAVAEVFG